MEENQQGKAPNDAAGYCSRGDTYLDAAAAVLTVLAALVKNSFPGEFRERLVGFVLTGAN